MPRKKHTKCSTEGCIGIRANRKPNPAKCEACWRTCCRRSFQWREYGRTSPAFDPGIDKFRSKAPPR